MLTWLTGGNAGLQAKVKSHTVAGVITLMLPMPSDPVAGDTFDIIAGCRKRLHEDCRDKFDNVVNFQGEPHLPGVDYLTADPDVQRMSAVTAADVVAAARAHIGTPWQHQGRLRGVALDCAGLVIMVARDLGIVEPDFDIRGYGRAPDGTMLAYCAGAMTALPGPELGAVLQPDHPA